LALVLLLSACGGATPTLQPATPSAPPEVSPASPTPTQPGLAPTPTQAASTAGVYPAAFGHYSAPAVKLPATFASSYTLPVDLSKVMGLDKIELSDAQRKLLSQNGFVVVPPTPGQEQEFYQIYKAEFYDVVPLFVTSDSVYHIYHLTFDKMLRDLETDPFVAGLKLLASAMLGATEQQYQTLRGTPLEGPALRNVAYFGVASVLLGLPDPIPAEAQALVDSESALILSANSTAISPIWDRPDLPADQKLIEIYGSYLPRGHYTRSDDLERYFRAMTWYGRMTFRLQDDFETRRALLLVQALRAARASDGRPAADLWQNIYDPTVFLVGKADDLGYHEYGALSDQVFGTSPDLSTFADDALLARFKQAAESLPPPQVNSMWVAIDQDPEKATKGFRFMGQRFTLDSYVFGQLLYPNVGTREKPRGLPKGLDFFAAMGSDEAYGILKGLGENQYAHYDEQMGKLKQEISALGTDSWTQGVYWAWLHALQPLIQPKDAAYPPFMQSPAWARKDLQTALGSWTELKHDTILYSKEAQGAGGGGPPDTQSYVEPNPEAYAQLLALGQMTYDGLQQRGLLSDVTRTNLENLLKELAFLQDVSERELAGETLTPEDTMHISTWAYLMEHMTAAAADKTETYGGDVSDQKAALVADVASGFSQTGEQVALEEATGQPALIYVVLPDSPWRIGAGAVYTSYEFPVPSGARLTDEAWQSMLDSGQNPAQPDWTQSFTAP
jgi:hypothetical protein